MATTDGVQTLEDLKAENDALDAAASSPPQAEETETEDAEVEDEAEELDEGAESESDDTDEPEIEAWMEADGHTSESAEKKFTDGDIGKAKQKLRTKLEKRHNGELDVLKAEIEQLKGRPTATPTLAKPRYEDFADHDDPDAAFNEALMDWKVDSRLAENEAKTASRELATKQQQEVAHIEKAVDQHTERAAQLLANSNITPEAFREAEYRVRETIDTVFPGAGDNVADGLISKLGEGSEKVMYNLGVNADRRHELIKRLKGDPTGLEAAIYLGELKTTLTTPLKRKTNAPRPGKTLNGDEKAVSASGRQLKKQYDQAAKKSDIQKAFDVKKEARSRGVDTSTW